MWEVFKDFEFTFTLTVADFSNNQNMLDNLVKSINDFDPKLLQEMFKNNPDMLKNSPFSDVDFSKLDKGEKGYGILLFTNFAAMLQISINRCIDSSLKIIMENQNKAKSITLSARIINKNINSPKPNDFLSATCIGNWLLDILKNPPDKPLDFSKLGYKKEYNKLNEPPLPDIPVIENPVLYDPFSKQKFTNIFELFNIENATNVDGKSVDPKADTKVNKSETSKKSLAILDYVFQYSYFLSFIGAISLSLSEVIGFTPLSYISEKVLLFIHIVIGTSAVVSLFAWFNTQIWYVDTSIINISNVSLKNNLPFLS